MAAAFGIRKMSTADIGPVSAAMARAFFDDPLQVWALPDPNHRLEALERMFALQSRHMSVPPEESYTDSTRSCAAYWAPPGRHVPDSDALAALTPLVEIVGAGALTRLQAAFAAMSAAHPSEPHFYLQGLGTDPRRQREGLGAAAMAPVLERCDTGSIPAYLESTKEQDVRFYERHGFAVTETITAPPDGPPLWCMWRAPRS
ncbi:MAG: GNAT family N-acetyltransferase [Actinomycetota bacterium]